MEEFVLEVRAAVEGRGHEGMTGAVAEGRGKATRGQACRREWQPAGGECTGDGQGGHQRTGSGGGNSGGPGRRWGTAEAKSTVKGATPVGNPPGHKERGQKATLGGGRGGLQGKKDRLKSSTAGHTPPPAMGLSGSQRRERGVK